MPRYPVFADFSGGGGGGYGGGGPDPLSPSGSTHELSPFQEFA